jgi:hypothetical protein
VLQAALATLAQQVLQELRALQVQTLQFKDQLDQQAVLVQLALQVLLVLIQLFLDPQAQQAIKEYRVLRDPQVL